MVSAINVSSTGGWPALALRTFSASGSTPMTLKPRWAKVAAMHAPSFPRPKTEMDSIDFSIGAKKRAPVLFREGL
jgi:hypothetical protein